MAKKNTLLTGSALLAAIGTAMTVEPNYLFITQAQAATVDPSLISVNTQITDGDKAAAILTDAGKAAVAAAPAAAPAGPVSFAILSRPVQAASRGGRGSNKYPFDQLEVGQSFFIPKTEANPDPAKRIASTVTSATDRFKVPVIENGAEVKEVVTLKARNGKPERTETRTKMRVTRKFAVQTITDGGEDGKTEGALVGRTA